jgi:MFS family permease
VFLPESAPWRYVLLLVGAGVVAAFQVGKAPPALPAIRGELGMSLLLAGWVLSAFNLVGLILGAMAGAAADAAGHRRILFMGLLCLAAGSILGAQAGSAAFLLGTRFLEGMGFLAVSVSGPALVARVTPPRDQRLALSVWSCFLPAGAAIVMLWTPLLTGWIGWRGIWWVNGLLLAAYALWFARFPDLAGSAASPRAVGLSRLWRDIARTGRSAGPLLLSAIFGTYAFQWLAVMGFLPTLLIEEEGFAPGRASMLTAAMVGMNVPGNLAGGWLLHRGARRWKLISAASLLMGACSLAIYAPHLPFAGRYLACLLFSLSGGLIPASVLGAAPLYAPSRDLVGTTNGLIAQGTQVGQVLGPPLLAVIVSSAGGWEAAPWLLGFSALVGAALAMGLGLWERKQAGK